MKVKFLMPKPVKLLDIKAAFESYVTRLGQGAGQRFVTTKPRKNHLHKNSIDGHSNEVTITKKTTSTPKSTTTKYLIINNYLMTYRASVPELNSCFNSN